MTYTKDNKDATKDATPATIIVAWVNFSPVPPEILIAGSSFDALKMVGIQPRRRKLGA